MEKPKIRFKGYQEDWEQRKFGDYNDLMTGYPFESDKFSEDGIKLVRGMNVKRGYLDFSEDICVKWNSCVGLENFLLKDGDILIQMDGALIGKSYAKIKENQLPALLVQRVTRARTNNKFASQDFMYQIIQRDFLRYIEMNKTETAVPHLSLNDIRNFEIMVPCLAEQKKIGDYFESLDHLITLHHRKQIYVLNTRIYAKTTLIITKEKKKMPELEKVIEDKLIEQLVLGESQWTYREDLKTEEDLWKNFRYILEQNNKARLDGQPLSDAEFEQVKNQLQFSSFYKAGEWLVGENGKAMVHVQRDTEKLHLVVMNHEHIAGGSSVYEVINQYNALKDDDITTVARDRRFDVTLMINGLPMIHIELKNRQHSYMDAFYQIKKYISEGKFTGIFSAVQMFVISNGVDTKYFAAASDTELNPKFMSGWVDTENNPVADYIDFAKNVLRIPEAHEMIARYTVLDEDAKR